MFTANLESVRKDVECVFGILKERWNCLQQGFKFRSIGVCRNIFVACCVLHNMMLDEMTKDDANSKIGHGFCLPNDEIWLDGHTAPTEYDNSKQRKKLSNEFHTQRDILATHLHVWRMQSKQNRIDEISCLYFSNNFAANSGLWSVFWLRTIVSASTM